MSRFSNLELDSDSESESQHEFVGAHVPKDESYYLGLAQEAFEQGDFEQALRRYSKVLEYNPDNRAAWNWQVRSLIELGEFREAKLWAEKALERFLDDAELLASKAVALARCGDLEAALAYSDASLEQHGNTPLVWLARGDVFRARQEPRADSCFEKALALAHHDWLVSWLISRVEYYYERFAVSLKAINTALKSNPEKEAIWVQKGLCLWELSMTGAAMESFQTARELNPGIRHLVPTNDTLDDHHLLSKIGRRLRYLFSR